MYGVATAAILVTMALALIRASRGPTVFDRVQAVNMMGTKTVLLIAVWGFLTGRPEWLDLAILYALMNFIGMIALLRFSRFGDLSGDNEVLVSDSGADAEEGANDTGGPA